MIIDGVSNIVKDTDEGSTSGVPLYGSRHENGGMRDAPFAQARDNQKTDRNLVEATSAAFTPLPPQTDTLPHRARTEHEEHIEKNERRDEVEPGLTEFRKQRELHVRQLEDLNKKARMVVDRIDKLNDDVEKLRQQWGDIEREKEALLSTTARYERKMMEQEKKVREDDKKAKKYHDYLMLEDEVLVLEDSSDDEDERRPVFDWGAQGHGGRGSQGA